MLQGRYLDALKMDVDDIRAVVTKIGDPGRYEGAIQQMGEYVWGLFQ